MKRLMFIFLVILLVSSVSAVKFDAQIEKELEKGNYVDVIIKLKDNNLMIKSLGKENIFRNQEKVIKTLSKVNARYKNVNAIAAKISKKEFENLKNDPNVDTVFADRVFSISLSASVPHINGDDVWSKQINNINLTGKDETVCVLDTGVDYNHNALKGRVIKGYDYVNNDNDPMDDNNHGTHVAGIIASNDTISRGVAPEAKIAAVKVISAGGGGSESDILDGIDWCISNKNLYNISVISMSLGLMVNPEDSNCNTPLTCAGGVPCICDCYDVFLSSYIDLAVLNNNMLIVVAGGNDGLPYVSAPGCAKYATSVGASEKSDDNFASFSSYNESLDIVAPGSSIYSTIRDNGFSYMSGTSMAAPHIAGAAALLKQYVKLQGYDLNSTNLNNSLGISTVTVSKNGLIFPRIDLLKAIQALDIVNPSIILVSPENKMYSDSNISLDYIAQDVNLDSVWYELNNINTTLNGNTRLNLSNGDYTLKVYTNDSNGNLNSTSVNFKIKASELIVNLDSPANNYEDKDGNVELNCSASDIYDLINLSLYTNLGGSFALNKTKNVFGLNAEASFILSNLADNTDFIWNCRTANNVSQNLFSYNRTLKIRINDAPVLSNTIPNQTWNEDTNLVINLNNYFSDEDGDILIYNSTNPNNMIVTFNNNIATLTPEANWWGNSNIKFYASDGEFIAESNLVNLIVNNMPDCGDNTCEGSESCSSCSADCGSCSTGGGGSSGGGGGSPVETAPAITPAVEAPKTTTTVTEPVKASAKEPEITGSAVKETEKPGFLRNIWEKAKNFFWKIIDFFKSIKFSEKE